MAQATAPILDSAEGAFTDVRQDRSLRREADISRCAGRSASGADDSERSLQLRRSTGIPTLPNVKTARSRRGIVPLTRQPSHREGRMPVNIGRRELMAALGGAAAAWPLAARAQQGERVRRIGVLMGTANDAEGQARVKALQQGLRDLGWVEGRNLRIDYRWTDGDPALIRTYAVELVKLSPDVIVAHTPPVIAAMRQASSSIPIVFAAVLDPVEHGFIDSLARPGGNLTGTTNIEFTLVGKMLAMLKEAAPGVVRAAVMFGTNTQYLIYLHSVGAVPPLAVELSAAAVRDTGEIEAVISKLGREPGGGLVVPPDAFTIIHRALILASAAHHRVPAIYAYRSYISEGGLMSYGPDVYDIFRRTASYVDRILKGAKPADLPVEAPVKYDLAINLKTAKVLGLEVPATLVATANEVIE
jgi:putative ABC transport system substrate-binding protein